MLALTSSANAAGSWRMFLDFSFISCDFVFAKPSISFAVPAAEWLEYRVRGPSLPTNVSPQQAARRPQNGRSYSLCSSSFA